MRNRFLGRVRVVEVLGKMGDSLLVAVTVVVEVVGVEVLVGLLFGVLDGSSFTWLSVSLLSAGKYHKLIKKLFTNQSMLYPH